MKQVYCSVAESQPGLSADPRVRAVSSGVTPERVQNVLRYASYKLPVRGGEASAVSQPPVRLALLLTPEAGRFLCHSVPLVPDEGPANGAYFSHLFLDVPGTVDAQQAIQSWASHLWQKLDVNNGVELPEALFLPVSSALGDEELVQFLAKPEHCELLRFVLTALLTTKPNTRIVLAAPSESVALCIYGITRALPPALLEEFTFSTYEHDVHNSPARVVGTCWDNLPDYELPSNVYQGQSVAYNTYTGKKSELPGEHPFVDFAVRTLAKGELTHLDELHADWQRLSIRDASLFEIVYRLKHGSGQLTKEESQQVLQHPALRQLVASRPEALSQFLDWALEDQSYATTSFSQAVTALRQKPDVLARLGQDVQKHGWSALQAGDLNRARNALEAILPMVAPAKAATVFNELFAQLHEPENLTWETRFYLLPRLARLQPLQPNQKPDSKLERWLDVPNEKLDGLLSLDVPKSYRLAACTLSLQHEGEPTPELGRILGRHPNVVGELLQQVPPTEAGQARGLNLFRAVLAENPQHPWLEEVLKMHRVLPSSFVASCIDSALDQRRVQANDLVSQHRALLLELLAQRPTLERLGEILLSQPEDNLRPTPERQEFLQALPRATELSLDLKERLDAYLGWHDFVKKPVLEREPLQQVATALRLQPPLFPESARTAVASAIAGTLGKAGPQSLQVLESSLETVGPIWPGGTTALYRALLHARQQHKTFWKNVDQVHAFLSVALGAGQSTELATQLDEPLDAEAYSLASQSAKVGGKKVLKALDAKTEAWPRQAHSQWTFLLAAVQPRSMKGFFRDFGFLFVGLLLGAGLIYLLRWLSVLP